MDIVISGCGKIGETIIASLVSEGLNITAIDSNQSVINEITNIYDVMGVCGNGADCVTLSEAGIEKSDLFVAVTNSDELNMLSCFIARKMGAKHTIARIRNPEYNYQSLSFITNNLNLSMSINPELLTARELFNILQLPSAVKIDYFSRNNFEIIELKIKENTALDGIKLSEFNEKFNAKILVCFVQREDYAHIPDGNFVLKSGDRIGITAPRSEINRLFKSLGAIKKKAKNIMIFGGSTTAYYLAKMLIESGTNVKIIESDRKRCHELCEILPKAVIIHGDGTQQELLLEEGLRSADAFVSLTGMDEENILISLFASSLNVPKVIAKINRNELASMAERLGLDCIISPKKTTSNIMIRYARALQNSLGSNVETLYRIMDGKAEALEFNVAADSKIINIPIKQLNLKKNILIAGIMRGRKTIIPSGDDTILADDKVVVFSENVILKDLSDIIK